ncbi:MAG TPA: class IV adenylate cyclase [Candidatus Dormibacteraeota bacterium]|nr:class IV adenylate cyclase [Candidatus Dormibacteraeota bacterium]
MEIEIKLRLTGTQAARRQLRRLGARALGRIHERDVLFDTPKNALQRSGRLLRVRSVRRIGRAGGARNGARPPAAGTVSGLLTYKGAPKGGRYKAREEIEVAIGKPEIAERILAELGFRPGFRYEKYRTSFRLPGLPRLAVELDETPIGVFFELEGPRDSIDRAAGRLGFGPGDYVTASYYDLFLAERHRLGLARDAMLFPASV